MTTLAPVEVLCALCNRASRQTKIWSTNTFGHVDLDLRPPEMKRGTMRFWLEECPHCGYVASEIAKSEPMIAEAMASPEWASLGDDGSSKLALRFRRRAVIDLMQGNPLRAADRLLWAAWDYDDEGEAHRASEQRRRAAELMTENLAEITKPEELANSRLRLVDVWRRAEEWDKAAAACDMAEETGLDEPVAAIVSFQRERIHARDGARYTVGDTMKVG